MSSGIAPRTLVSQVEQTASWALAGDAEAAPHTFRAALRRVDEAEAAWSAGPPALPYVRLLLAAHFATVATFVPTDVDVRIRHHVWTEIEDEETLLSACDLIDEASRWDVTRVSARTVSSEAHGVLSGHDGEWLSVRAGALGRALQLGSARAVERLVTALDDELTREQRIFDEARRDPFEAMRAATTVAHNLGDLSRVAEGWTKVTDPEGHRARYVKLGHEGGRPWSASFLRAGALNKALMADENHRFLPLRQARCLRQSRELLLPIGPFFHAWGARLARFEAFTEEDHAEVVAALLEVHARRGTEQGCLRALAGVDGSLRGGLNRLAPALPARLRKLLETGPVREALKLPEDRFLGRLRKRYETLG